VKIDSICGWPAVPIEHIPSPTECTTDVVEAILDRLTELGWRPATQPDPCPNCTEPTLEHLDGPPSNTELAKALGWIQ
jgi:hypothetical protein